MPLSACSDSSHLTSSDQGFAHDVAGARKLQGSPGDVAQQQDSRGSTSLELWLPKGVSRNDAVLVSAGELIGAEEVDIFPGTSTQAKVVEDLFQDESTVREISSGDLTAHVGQVDVEPSLAWTVRLPDITPTLRLTSGQRHALSVGAHYFDELSVEGGSQLLLEGETGPVIIYVKHSVNLNAQVSGSDAGARLLIVALGSEVVVNGAFRGSIFAPHAALTVGSAASIEGSLIASSMSIGVGVKVHFKRFRHWNPSMLEDRLESHLSNNIETEPVLSKSWVGDEYGIAPGKWFYRGVIPPQEVPHEQNTMPSPSTEGEREVDVDDQAIPDGAMAVVLEDGRVFRVELSEPDRTALASALRSRGWAEGATGDDNEEDDGYEFEEEDGMVPKGWHGGDDGRVPRGLFEGNATESRRIGRLTNGCTAAFVGTPETDYYVLTAAHCLFNPNTGAWTDPNFEPRRDRCLTDTGSAHSPCDTRPYGTWNGGVYMTYNYYLDNCRAANTDYTAECRANDIAMIRVARPSGEDFPGAYGFGSYSKSTIDGKDWRRSRGYPTCGDDGGLQDTGGVLDGAGFCRDQTLWATTFTLGSYEQSDRTHRTSGDFSPGQSGSPLYMDDGGLKAFGVAVTTSPSGCYSGCATSRPSYGRRITSGFYASMLTFMGI